MKRKLTFTTMSCPKYLLVSCLFILLFAVKKIACDKDKILKFLPVSKEIFADLGKEVCSEFFWFDNTSEAKIKENKCIEKFTKPSKSFISPPSKLTINCRSETIVEFSITPSKSWQLVVLVPDDENDNINYNLLNVGEENATTSLSRNSSVFWTTSLNNDGTPTIWRRGPRLPPWKKAPDNYTVKIGDFKIEYEKGLIVKAVFRILFFGETTACATNVNLINTCDYRALGENDIKILSPNSNHTISFKLRKDSRCSMEMRLNGRLIFTHQYNTSLTFKIKEEEFEPEIIKDLSLHAKSVGATWNVQVKWSRPIHDPYGYNLTLYAPGVLPRMTPFIYGNSTEYIFEDVPGEEMARFDVIIVAKYNTGVRRNVASALFLPRSNYRAVVVTGTWSLILTVAAAALGAVIWCRRKTDKIKRGYAPPNHPKTPKECLVQACLETGVEDSWEVRSERLLLHEVIGEGAFGVVRKGTLAPTGREVAVKMLKDFSTVEEMRSFRTEMELMKSVGAHPHVVSLIGCCSGVRPLIVAEYCSRGDLLNFLRCSWDVMVSKRNAKYYNNNLEGDYRNDLFKKPHKELSKLSQLVVNKLYDLQGICDSELTPLDLLSFCRQIAMGMEFLASNRVVHRDLAARNILVTSDRTLKIADFGLSRDVYQENQYKQKGNGKMPIKWMALESLTHRIYTTQSDVWSFGVVVWEVVTVGGAPYPGVPPARLPRLLRAGYRMPRPNNCSKPLYELMQSCWRARPRDRPTFSALHSALDELLNSACADEYLSLELDDDAPPTPKPQRYLKMLLRGNKVWARGENYERPLKGFQSNHYSSPPASINKSQAI